MSAKPIGWIVTGSGHVWLDADGRVPVFATEAEALSLANGIYPITGAALPLVRWKPSPKPRHDYGKGSE